MKILLSAYACEPNKGSEPGVGWHWAQEIENLGYEVWVLTRSNNKSVIDEYFLNNVQRSHLHFEYYDLPDWLKKWKKGGRFVRSYYFLWQWGASSLAKKLHQKLKFDCVQHITFVSARQPSFMWRLNIPFIFGPVAGGEKAPFKLRRNFGLKGFVIDLLRDGANYLVRFDPFMRVTFKKATKIIVTSKQTKQLIHKKFQEKTVVQLAIGIDTLSDRNCPKAYNSLNYKILYIGRFVYWKGMYLGLSAFAQVLKEYPLLKLTLVGKGSDKQQWIKHAEQLGINDNLDWIDWVDQDKLSSMYKEYDLLLFPSLHDSGGMVVLESMAQSLPVACLNLGGPGVIVNNECGINIEVDGFSENEIIEDLTNKIRLFFTDNEMRKKLQQKAFERSQEYKWSNVVGHVYKSLKD